MYIYRAELFAERSRRSRAEEEARVAREAAAQLRVEAARRSRLSDARRVDREYAGQLDAASHRAQGTLLDTQVRLPLNINFFSHTSLGGVSW